MAVLRRLQHELARDGARDEAHEVPYTTLHVGVMAGGTALNIVPNRCRLDFEIRHLPADDPRALLERVEAEAAAIVRAAREHAPEADIAIETRYRYPGLETPAEAPIVDFVRSLSGVGRTLKVAFGTEGGLFAERLELPTVVCGPGSMAQGHRPDEFVSRAQLDACEAMLERLLRHLSTPPGARRS